MKSLKRVLALTLAIVLVIGLIPSGVSAATLAATKSHALDEFNPQAGKTVWSTGFEVGTGDYDIQKLETDEGASTSDSDKTTSSKWNSYAPVNRDKIYVVNTGASAVFYGSENEGIGQSGCIKIETKGNNRGRIEVVLPTNAGLKSGKLYTISVWIKQNMETNAAQTLVCAGTKHFTQMEVSGEGYATNSNTKYSVGESFKDQVDEWVQLEVPFVYESSIKFDIGLSTAINSDNYKDYVFYIDNLEVKEYGVAAPETEVQAYVGNDTQLEVKTSQTNAVVKYSLDDTTYAEVNADTGVVTGKSAGVANVKVTVYMPVPPTKESPTIASGKTEANYYLYTDDADVTHGLVGTKVQWYTSYGSSTYDEAWARAYGFVKEFTIPVTVSNALTYGELQTALGTETKVTMPTDVNGTGENMALPAGKTLDLNGKTLTVDSLAALKGANVIDSVGGGKIVVAQGNLMLQKNNTQLSVRAEDDSGYLFFAVKDQHNQNGNTENALRYNTRPSLGSTDTNGQYLADGAADNGLTIMVRLTWTNNSGLATTMDVAATDSLIQSVYGDTGAISLTASGVSNLTNFKVATVIVSDTGVEHVGEALTYTYPAPEA